MRVGRKRTPFPSKPKFEYRLCTQLFPEMPAWSVKCIVLSSQSFPEMFAWPFWHVLFLKLCNLVYLCVNGWTSSLSDSVQRGAHLFWQIPYPIKPCYLAYLYCIAHTCLLVRRISSSSMPTTKSTVGLYLEDHRTRTDEMQQPQSWLEEFL